VSFVFLVHASVNCGVIYANACVQCLMTTVFAYSYLRCLVFANGFSCMVDYMHLVCQNYCNETQAG
jgi:hypothetical protein